MRAAVLEEFNLPLAVEDLTPPPLGPRDVRVMVEASGVCHSDLYIAKGSSPTPLPMIAGHEGAGKVIGTGSEITRVRVGDRVIAAFTPVCEQCFFCVHGQSNLCTSFPERRTATRGFRPDGSSVVATAGLGTFAEEMTAHENMLVRVDTDLPSEQLALLGCGVTTGVGAALNTAQVRPGSTVAVFGCGGVGQSVVQGARIAGAARIFAIDTVEMKRAEAGKQGATDLVDPALGSVPDQVREMTAGLGADYAFEVIGLPDTILAAFETARRGGTVVVVGMAKADATITFPALRLFYDEKRLLGSYYGSAQVRRDFPRFIRLVESGRLDIGSMVSRRVRLEQVNEAFSALEAGEVIRTLIV